MRLDGSAPLILYAYGAYGASEPADFDAKRISLLDRSIPVRDWLVAGELQGYNVRVHVTPNTLHALLKLQLMQGKVIWRLFVACMLYRPQHGNLSM